MRNNILKTIFFVVVFIASIFLQYIVLIPGSSLYENNAQFVTFSLIAYACQIFLIIWLFSKCRVCVGLIFALVCFANIYINIYYQEISKQNIIYKDAFVSIGYVTMYESLKTCNRVCYTFYDVYGKQHDVAERFTGPCESDTILVLFNGSLPCYFKHYSMHPSKDEVKLYLDGPRKLINN